LKPPKKPSFRLFCFPYAGGGIPVFWPWAHALPETIELRVVQLPGRGTRLREKPFTRLEPLADVLREKVAPLLDLPFGFFGHSLGALVAFETARRLARCGPAHLFVSGHVAPQVPDPNRPIHTLPDAVFLEELRALNGIPQAVLRCRELLDLMLPVLRADFELLENYTYQRGPALSCPITAFAGENDPRTTLPHVEAWRFQSRAGFSLVLFPGDHFFLDTERSRLLEVILRTLRKIE
jgi:medium-chain acyl-[acyl-carrier-protein] hydrolase